MSTFKILLLVIGTGISLGAAAHSASRQKIVLSTDIHASAAEVWKLVGDFNAWQRWLPMVEATREAGDGHSAEARRTLVLKESGSRIVESLDMIDDGAMTLKYRIREVDTNVFPVNTYSSTIVVKSIGPNDAKVEWRGAYFRADQNFDPPAKFNDDAATEAVSQLYSAGLNNLKKVAEQMTSH